jgi:hypothetical protein
VTDLVQALTQWSKVEPQPSLPTILPTWLWDDLEQQGDPLFCRLRDAGRVVRNQVQ